MAISETAASPEQPVRTGRAAERYHTERCRYIKQAADPTPVSESLIGYHDLDECPECQRVREEGVYYDISFDELREECRQRGEYAVGMERGELIAVLRDSDFDPEEVGDD